MADIFQPIAPRPSPVRTSGFGPWMKANLFADWRSTATTFFLLFLGLAMVPKLLNWGLFRRYSAPMPMPARLRAARVPAGVWSLKNTASFCLAATRLKSNGDR